jgi:plastocyanin
MKRSKIGLCVLIVFVAFILMIVTTGATSVLRAQPTNSTNTGSIPPTANQVTTRSNDKTFYLFTAEHDGLNETKLGIPADTYSPDVLLVNKGDNITVHFYNLDTTDRHTFTIGAPYNINEDLLPLHNGTIEFKANQEGIFRFYCTYHQPTMAGQLAVQEPPTVEKINSNVPK